MKLENACLSATVLALVLAIDPLHADEQRVRTRAAAPAPEASAADPRDPADFSYGEYHRSSKMTPGGSEGPTRWGNERDDIGAPVSGSGASGGSSATEAENDDEADAGSEVGGTAGDQRPVEGDSAVRAEEEDRRGGDSGDRNREREIPR